MVVHLFSPGWINASSVLSQGQARICAHLGNVAFSTTAAPSLRRIHRYGATRSDSRKSQTSCPTIVHDHLAGMLIKRCDHFETLGAVVYLMERAPQQFVLMAPTMPPVENECSNEIGEQTACDRSDVPRQAEKRPNQRLLKCGSKY